MESDHASHRKLAAILMADAVGYSRLMGADEAATVAAIKASRAVFRAQVERRAGRIVNAPGDSVLAEFGSVVDALAAAVEIQRELAERNERLPVAESMQFRIGINLGDVVSESDAVYGDGVNIAARLEALAEPGGICISRAAHEQVRGKLPLQYEDLGEHSVKNIAEPVRVYRVLSLPGAAAHRVSAAHARGFRAGKWVGLSAAAVLVASLVLAGALYQFGESDAPPPDQSATALPLPDKPSIAVLPFDNLSGDPEQEYFADGFTETLITDLSKLQNLFVIARNSTFRYKGQAVDVRRVGQELGVRHVLEGSIQRADERLRINVQLTDALDGSHIWAERYDRPAHDIFALQDEIARHVVTEMDVQLVEGEKGRAWRDSTSDPKAYDLFLRGKDVFQEFTRDSQRRAREYFQTALEHDPEFTAALAWLAWTYINEVYNDWMDEREVWLDKAMALALKARELDEESAVAHLTVGEAHLARGELEAARASYNRAYELGFNEGNVVAIVAWNNSYLGQPELAIEMAERAIRMDPHMPTWYLGALGMARLANGQAMAAIDPLLTCTDDLSEWFWCRAGLVVAYVENGQLSEATSHASELLRQIPELTAVENDFARQTELDPQFQARVIAALRAAGIP